MKEHHYSIQKTVRYVTIGEVSTKVKHLWICLHGYGQLAKWFAKRFEGQEHMSRLFVIPEGPHRFYLEGTSGRVGASWMTKEDRLLDIVDQFNYLEALTTFVHKELSPNCKIHLLGFSQGVSTAFRWILKSKQQFNSLVCWAGSFPPEIEYAKYASLLNAMRISACFGDADEYISVSDAQKLEGLLKVAGINLITNFYKGEHRIYDDLLKKVIASHEAQ